MAEKMYVYARAAGRTKEGLFILECGRGGGESAAADGEPTRFLFKTAADVEDAKKLWREVVEAFR